MYDCSDSGMTRTKRRREHSVKGGKGKCTFHRVMYDVIHLSSKVYIILYTYLLNISELYMSSFSILLANPTHLTLLTPNLFSINLCKCANDSIVLSQTPKKLLKSIQLCRFFTVLKILFY